MTRPMVVVAVCVLALTAADLAPVFSFYNEATVSLGNLFATSTVFPASPHLHDALTTLQTPLTNGLAHYAAQTVGGTAYVFGGQTSLGDSDRVYRFDEPTETLVELPVTLPTPRRMLDAAERDGLVYLFGGITGGTTLSEVLVFDPDTLTISSLGSIMPYPASGLLADRTLGDIYILGGFDGGMARAEIHRFDPDGPTFVDTGHTMPHAMHGIEGASTGAMIHVMGGVSDGAVRRGTTFTFSPSAPTAILQGDDLDEAREWAAVAWDGKNAWALGGHAAGGRSTAIDIHDPAGGATVAACLSLPAPRAGAEAIFLDGAAYIIGGENDAVKLQTMVRFVPALACTAIGSATIPTALPTAARGIAAATDGTGAYLFGGWTGTTRLADVIRFDPGTASFTARSPLPVPTAHMALVQHDADVYLFGGTRDDGPTAHVLHYDMSSDTFADLGALLPVGAWGIAAAYHNGAAYLAGGQSATENLTAILRFDPLTQNVTDTGHDLPSGRYLAHARSDGQHVYFFGGRNTTTSFDDVLRYDPTSGAVVTLAPLARGTAGAGLVFDGQTHWLLGGEDGTKHDDIIAYATTSQTTRIFCESLPEDASQHATVLIDGTAWLFGGHLPGNTVTDRIVSFRPDDSCERIQKDERRGVDLPDAAGTVALRTAPGITYLFGAAPGSTAGDRVLRYVEDTDTLEDLGELMPHPVHAPAAVYDGLRYVYLLGGADTAGNPLATIQRYDTTTGLAEVVDGTLPSGLFRAQAYLHDGLVYVAGGRTAGGTTTASIVVYDPSNDTAFTAGWTLPEGRERATGASVDGVGYLFGGSTPGEAFTRDIVRIDFDTNTTETLDYPWLPHAVRDAAAATDGESIWVVGGEAANGFRPDVLRFDAATTILHRLCVHLPQGTAAGPAMYTHAREALYHFGGQGLAGPIDHVVRLEGRPPCYHDPVERVVAMTASGLSKTAAIWTGRFVYTFGGAMNMGVGDVIHRYDPFLDEMVVLDTVLPFDLQSAAVAWTGSEAYLFGGHTGTTYVGTILRFDPADESITTLVATLPTPRADLAALWDGSHAYLFGGHNGVAASTEVLRFDPTTSTLANVATLSGTQGRWDAAAAYDGRYGYLIGGRDSSIGDTNRIWRFDPTTLAFGEMPGRLSSPRGAHAAVFDQERNVYIFGGSNGTHSDDIQSFDVQTRAVATLAPTLDVGRSDLASVWIGDAAILVGGETATGIASTHLRFDPDPEEAPEGFVTWRHDPGPGVTAGPLIAQGHRDGAAVAYDGLLYQFGGRGTPGVERMWYTVDPSTGVVETKVPLPFDMSFGAAAVVGDFIYAKSGQPNVLYRLDPVAETWTRLADPPATNEKTDAMEAYDGSLYLFGGDPTLSQSEVARYDVGTDTWTTIGTIEVGGNLLTSAIDGADIYITGGSQHGRVSVYNVTTGTSATLGGPAPESLRSSRVAFLQGALYAFGGPCCSPDYIQKWDPTTNTWSLLPKTLVDPTVAPSVTQAGGTAYILSGFTSAGYSLQVTYFQPS